MTDSENPKSENTRRHADDFRLEQRVWADTVREQLNTADGPDGCCEHPLPGPDPRTTSEASVSISLPSDPWTREVRHAAIHAVRIAAARREAGDRTLRYFLRSALGHGLTIDEVCKAARLDRATVLELTDPAVA